MSRGLEYLDEDEDSEPSFEKIKHKPKLTARGEDAQKRKRDDQIRKNLRRKDKYEE